MKKQALDLNRTYPRSAREKLGGYLHLARMIDKARAKAAGSLGEYRYPCPIDQSLLELLGVESEAFLDAAKDQDEEGVLKWLRAKAKARSPGEVEKWNQELLDRKPQNDESLLYFQETRARVAPDRQDVSTWVDLLDLEERREVPLRS